MHFRTTLAALAALAGAIAFAPAAQAQSNAAAWQCSASALRSTLQANPPYEPVIANGGAARCVDSATGVPNTAQPAGAGPDVATSGTTTASTSIDPDSGPSASQTVSAVGRVESAVLKLPPGTGTVTLGVDAATARAAGACAAGSPQLAGTSEAVNVRINDTVVANDQVAGQLAALLPGQVVTLKFNEQVASATSLTQRALHLTIAGPDGTPIYEYIGGEATVGFSGAVCADTGADPGDGGTLGNLKPCADGSTLNAGSGLCEIRIAATAIAGERVIIVGLPFEGPSGGTVIALDEARKRYRSTCLDGAGPKFAVLGTNRADRITGTNRADRILLLAGNDRGDGGRGNDCIDGGSGRDVLSGALGNDKVLGTTGNDAINGGAGTDHLSGGTGNDTINAAYGRDRVLGGSGRDFINIATAGPAARVSCGAGADKVRVNYNERSRTTGCETRYVLRDRKSLQKKG